jgi:hypothetical protein
MKVGRLVHGARAIFTFYTWAWYCRFGVCMRSLGGARLPRARWRRKQLEPRARHVVAAGATCVLLYRFFVEVNKKTPKARLVRGDCWGETMILSPFVMWLDELVDSSQRQ